MRTIANIVPMMIKMYFFDMISTPIISKDIRTITISKQGTRVPLNLSSRFYSDQKKNALK